MRRDTRDKRGRPTIVGLTALFSGQIAAIANHLESDCRLRKKPSTVSKSDY
jgi:hypothetical protein